MLNDETHQDKEYSKINEETQNEKGGLNLNNESSMKTKDELEKSEQKQEEENDADEKQEINNGGKRKRKRKRKKKAAKDDDVVDSGNLDSSNINKFDSLDHTVFVEGIPFELKDDDIKEFFIENGVEDIIQMRLPTWQDTGRLRGFGHIVFDTTDSRNKALKELNGKTLGRRYITIQEAKPSATSSNSRGSDGKPRVQPEGCKVVFIRNLPYRDIEESDVEEVFRSCGKIVDGGVRLTRNYQTQELKGFGYIEFKNPEGAYAAVQRGMKGTLIVGGRACYVDYDEGKGPKGSFRNATGKLWRQDHRNTATSNARSRFKKERRERNSD